MCVCVCVYIYRRRERKCIIDGILKLLWLLVIEGADQIVVVYKISTGAAPKVLTN